MSDEVAQLQEQYNRILNTTRHLESLSVFSDYGACIGNLASSPVRSPLNLASLSETYRSPYTDGSPTTATTGLGIYSVSSSSMSDSYGMRFCGSSNRISLRVYVQSCSTLNRR